MFERVQDEKEARQPPLSPQLLKFHARIIFSLNLS